jgi:hypothetical protein
MSAALGWDKRTVVAQRGAANDANRRGWHEARAGDRPGTRKAFAWPAPSNEHRFLLESRPAVALRRDPKSLDGDDASAQSNFANDHEVDIAHA